MAGKTGRNKARPPKIKKLTDQQTYQSSRPSKAVADDVEWKVVKGILKPFKKK